MPTLVDFWIDPSCPWSWLTAQWLKEVEDNAEVSVRWHVMSLAVLNEGGDIPEEWRSLIEQSWGPLRALEQSSRTDPSTFWPLMAAFCRRYHGEGRRDVAQILVEAVAECGLPTSIADDAWSTELDDDIRASHADAMALGGNDVGSPILGMVGPEGVPVGFLGPVVSQVPRGPAALQLWEGLRLMVGTPGFYELKRTRDVEPDLT